MKNLMLVVAVSLLFATSCKKEKNTPVNQPQDCNCGLVLSDNASNYSVVLRNSCTGNEMTFYLHSEDWMNAHVGWNYCIENLKNSGKITKW